jgi:SAM-dependent methyltransferase
LHHPLQLPRGTAVRYLDRLTNEQLRTEYPELNDLPLVDVSIVEDGENPRSLVDESLDFVIASHVIEHCEDPIGTISNWLRVLRPGGVIYLVVPNRKRTFDRDREPTPVQDLLRDYREGPAASRMDHYLEWIESNYPNDPDPQAHAEELAESGYRIHFHVWTPKEFRTAVERIAEEENLPLEVAATKRSFREFMVVLRKTPARAKPNLLSSLPDTPARPRNLGV